MAAQPLLINFKGEANMKTLIGASKELSKKEEYLMIHNQATKKLKDAVGMVFGVDMWALIKNVDDEDGTESTILSIKTSDGDFYATNSATFIKEFNNIVEIFGVELPEIEVLTGTSKNGRDFISCTISDE